MLFVRLSFFSLGVVGYDAILSEKYQKMMPSATFAIKCRHNITANKRQNYTFKFKFKNTPVEFQSYTRYGDQLTKPYSNAS